MSNEDWEAEHQAMTSGSKSRPTGFGQEFAQVAGTPSHRQWGTGFCSRCGAKLNADPASAVAPGSALGALEALAYFVAITVAVILGDAIFWRLMGAA